jgi:hypothetical protein
MRACLLFCLLLSAAAIPAYGLFTRLTIKGEATPIENSWNSSGVFVFVAIGSEPILPVVVRVDFADFLGLEPGRQWRLEGTIKGKQNDISYEVPVILDIIARSVGSGDTIAFDFQQTIRGYAFNRRVDWSTSGSVHLRMTGTHLELHRYEHRSAGRLERQIPEVPLPLLARFFNYAPEEGYLFPDGIVRPVDWRSDRHLEGVDKRIDLVNGTSIPAYARIDLRDDEEFELTVGFGERETGNGKKLIKENWYLQRRAGFRRIESSASYSRDTWYRISLERVEEVGSRVALPRDYVLEPSVRLGTGWRWNSRLGVLFDDHFPWVYTQTLGWLFFPEDADRDSLWVYCESLGWIYLRHLLRSAEVAVPPANPYRYYLNAEGEYQEPDEWRQEVVTQAESGSFPLLYSADRRSWLWLEREAAAPGRWFYDFARAEWFSISQAN